MGSISMLAPSGAEAAAMATETDSDLFDALADMMGEV